MAGVRSASGWDPCLRAVGLHEHRIRRAQVDAHDAHIRLQQMRSVRLAALELVEMVAGFELQHPRRAFLARKIDRNRIVGARADRRSRGDLHPPTDSVVHPVTRTQTVEPALWPRIPTLAVHAKVYKHGRGRVGR